jgi:uncharacterized membrane protein
VHTFASLRKKPSASELSSLRLVLAVGGAAVSLLLFLALHRSASFALMVLGVAAALAALTLVPVVNHAVWAGWMGLGLALGTVTSPVLLGLVWILLFVPLGLIFRVAGRDPLQRRFPSERDTFWEPHPPPRDVRNYYRQF